MSIADAFPLPQESRNEHIAASGEDRRRSRWGGPLATLVVHRELIWQMTRREMSSRYKGTALGVVWSLVNPLSMLCVYTFAFAYVLKISPRGAVTTRGDVIDFALVVFAGMILFNLMSETFNRAAGCVAQNANYVKKVVFPLEILPCVLAGTAMIHAIIGVAVLIVATACLHGYVAQSALLAPLYVLPLVLMVLGCSWVIAALGAYLRDLGHVIAILTTAMLYVSPVFYSMETVHARNPFLGNVIRLNPLTVPLENFRATILGPALGGPFAPVQWTLFHAAASVAVAWIGLAIFQRTRRGFADVV